MKKIFSTIAALFTVMCLTFTCFAEETVKSFSMVSNTGIITLKGGAAVELSIEPDVYEDDSIVIYNNGTVPNITSVKLEVEGLKYHRNYTINNSYNFKNYSDIACTIPTTDNSGAYWKLNIYTDTAPVGTFLIDVYEEIYSIGITATAYFETDSSEVYYNWTIGSYITNTKSAFDIVKYFDDEGTLTSIIEDLITEVDTFSYANKEVKNDYPFLPNTDRDHDGIIYKTEVDILSYSMLGAGNGIKGFEGLASQVSTFFNKKDNGKIVFKITSAPAVISSQWVEGGVPSTQVGLYDVKNLQNNVIGLFFNYNTTGSLMSQGQITNDGYIIFDITDVLRAIGGNTISTISSIFYGMVGGISYTDYPVRGFKIDEVTLSYEEDGVTIGDVFAPVTTPITTTTIAETTEPEQWFTGVVETTTEAVTTTIETTPKTTTTEESIIDTDNGANDVIVPDPAEADYDTTTIPDAILLDDIVSTTDTDDEDENPRTGVAVAIVPPVVFAAIAFLFKKRK